MRFVFVGLLVFFGSLIAADLDADETGASHDYTRWMASSGNWADGDRWSDGRPDGYRRVEIHGVSNVLVPTGTYLIGDLEIGLEPLDRAHVEVDGGQLILMQDSLRVGELTGGEGEFVLKNGAMHCFMDVYVGAANGVPGRATKAAMRIQGGSFLGRTLLVGSVGAPNRCWPSKDRALGGPCAGLRPYRSACHSDGTPGNTTLKYTLDEHGVTPITIQARYRGLQIIKDAQSHCRLQIALCAVPPRDDITLVSSHVPIKGTFDELPEGSEITADYAGQTYRWQVTYRGGPQGHDLVLRNKSQYAADAPVTHGRPLPEIPKALWTEHRLYPLEMKRTASPPFRGPKVLARGLPAVAAAKPFTWKISTIQARAVCVRPSRPRDTRIILFRVGGVIPLKSTLRHQGTICHDRWPECSWPGIMLRNHGIEVRTHDVVLRYFRVRVGDDDVHLDEPKAREAYEGGAGEHALYFIEGSQNCIADHLSLSWSTTKILSITKLCDQITVQWCMLSEALNFADHGYASLAGGNRVTWHHNLFAHNQSRNVRFQGMVDADFRNNVIYDWGERAGYGEFDRVNYIGNYLKAGPSTAQKPFLFFHLGDAEVSPGSLFVKENILEGNGSRPGVNENNWLGIGSIQCPAQTTLRRPSRFRHLQSPRSHRQRLISTCSRGRRYALPKRDAVDERIIREVRDGTGHIVNRLADIGGWPDFPASNPQTQNTRNAETPR